MVRTGWGGIGAKPPTLTSANFAAEVKPSVVSRPSGSTAVKMVDGPTPPDGTWKVNITCPLGPIAGLPKLPPSEPGTSSGAVGVPTAPSPVTPAPTPPILPLLSRYSIQRLSGALDPPGPMVSLGWSATF